MAPATPRFPGCVRTLATISTWPMTALGAFVSQFSLIGGAKRAGDVANWATSEGSGAERDADHRRLQTAPDGTEASQKRHREESKGV
jgi:hypothetical protein